MRLAPLVVSFLLLASPVLAEPPETSSSTDDELADLLSILEEETEIATKTRMNSDFVPGIVTVRSGDELEALGVRNAWEALSTIPGVQAVLDELGRPSVIVRGVPFPFNSGNIHILVNGVPLSREAAGVNGTVLFIPVEQIDRIEFIRGPGSVLYGDFAFQGLANIVTRRSGLRADVSADTDHSFGTGLAWAAPGDKPAFSIDVAGFTTDEPPVPVNRPAEADRMTAFLTMRTGDFSLVAQAIDQDQAAPVVPSPGPPLENTETSWAVEARYDRDLSDDLRLHGHAQFLDNDLATTGAVFDGDRWETALEFAWTGWNNQQWLASVEYSDAEIDYAAQRRPGPPGQPPLPLTPVGVGETRQVFSVVLQDQVQISDAFTVTLGARYDDASDIGERVTPRISAVWRVAENHIVKAQYAEGYRAPTFFELYRDPGQPTLDYEVNKTTEVNYIYRRPNLSGRVTLFHSRIDDMIFVGQPFFENDSSAEADGVELEWSQRLGELFRIEANVSTVDAEDSRNQQNETRGIVIAAPWMSNLSLFFSPTGDWITSARWNHVADRDETADDDSYDLVDVTLSRKNLFIDGLALRIGVQNAFDEEVIYYSPLPNRNVANLYDGRTWWARISWIR
jgi:iron complex outermembrane receptor protein